MRFNRRLLKTVGVSSTCGAALFALAVFPFIAPPSAKAESLVPQKPTATTVKPIEVQTDVEALNITNDIPIAEAQAKAYPENPEAQFLLAIAYSRSPYLEKALEVLKRTKKLVKRNPERYEVLNRMIGEYEGILETRPDDPLILYRLAFGYYLKGYALDRYIKDSGESSDDWFDKAEATMRRVVERDPADVWARNYLGYLVAEHATAETAHARLDQAVKIWEESVAVNPDNPGAYLLLGEAYMKRGNMKKAAQFAAKGLRTRAGLGF